MESERSYRGGGWLLFSSAVLVVGGVLSILDGVVALTRSSFFTESAVFVFSDLQTWGYIILGLGVLSVAAGFAVLSRREGARWTGVGIAALSVMGQMLFAQAYPLWTLLIIAVDFMVIYGLTVYGGRAAQSAVSTREEPERRLRDVSSREERAA